MIDDLIESGRFWHPQKTMKQAVYETPFEEALKTYSIIKSKM